MKGKESSIQQVPSLGKKFNTFEQYGNATLIEVYGESLSRALRLKASTFASAYIENLGNSRFKINPLPALAQVSSLNNIIIRDFNHDGLKDLLISGNLYQSEVEVPRNDAGTGLLLLGNGHGSFTPIDVIRSGFFAPYDAKDMKIIKMLDREVVLVANNGSVIQAFACSVTDVKD